MPRGACPFFVVGPGCSESVPVWTAWAAVGSPREEVEEQAMRGTRTYLVLLVPVGPSRRRASVGSCTTAPRHGSGQHLWGLAQVKSDRGKSLGLTPPVLLSAGTEAGPSSVLLVPSTWQENRLYRTVGRLGWCRGALV